MPSQSLFPGRGFHVIFVVPRHPRMNTQVAECSAHVRAGELIDGMKARQVVSGHLLQRASGVLDRRLSCPPCKDAITIQEPLDKIELPCVTSPTARGLLRPFNKPEGKIPMKLHRLHYVRGIGAQLPRQVDGKLADRIGKDFTERGHLLSRVYDDL